MFLQRSRLHYTVCALVRRPRAISTRPAEAAAARTIARFRAPTPFHGFPSCATASLTYSPQQSFGAHIIRTYATNSARKLESAAVQKKLVERLVDLSKKELLKHAIYYGVPCTSKTPNEEIAEKIAETLTSGKPLQLKEKASIPLPALHSLLEMSLKQLRVMCSFLQIEEQEFKDEHIDRVLIIHRLVWEAQANQRAMHVLADRFRRSLSREDMVIVAKLCGVETRSSDRRYLMTRLRKRFTEGFVFVRNTEVDGRTGLVSGESVSEIEMQSAQSTCAQNAPGSTLPPSELQTPKTASAKTEAQTNATHPQKAGIGRAKAKQSATSTRVILPEVETKAMPLAPRDPSPSAEAVTPQSSNEDGRGSKIQTKWKQPVAGKISFQHKGEPKVHKLTLSELIQYAASVGLATTGTKDELRIRVKAFLKENRAKQHPPYNMKLHEAVQYAESVGLSSAGTMDELHERINAFLREHRAKRSPLRSLTGREGAHYAESIGLSSAGTRQEILKRIRAFLGVSRAKQQAPGESEGEEPEEKRDTMSKSSKTSRAKQLTTDQRSPKALDFATMTGEQQAEEHKEGRPKSNPQKPTTNQGSQEAQPDLPAMAVEQQPNEKKESAPKSKENSKPQKTTTNRGSPETPFDFSTMTVEQQPKKKESTPEKKSKPKKPTRNQGSPQAQLDVSTMTVEQQLEEKKESAAPKSKKKKSKAEKLTTNQGTPEARLDFSTMTVEQLKSHVRRYGLPLAGTKPFLKRRLENHLQEIKPLPSPRTIVAIDVGALNLGYVRLTVPPFDGADEKPTITDWGLLNMSAPFNSLSAMASECVGIADRITNPPADIYIIERQSWRSVGGRMAIPVAILASRTIEGMLIALLSDQRRAGGKVQDMTPGSVSQHFDLHNKLKAKTGTSAAVVTSGHYAKKDNAVSLVKSLVKGGYVTCPPGLLERFLNTRKKDDISDALLIGLTWIDQWTAAKKDAALVVERCGEEEFVVSDPMDERLSAVAGM
ncbi:uncharacterized protein EV422DRAFT_523327 [Fimicolochytrium jonesii]|uniref:uncharacterized protein n=1 Tax=Fimicolochytrium jonesii TaxID=1396493 RepID=UPI0022FEC1D6|nr:uncharacterized protein EV422DRAFT_523327 [Fimicolochytrium jonesii]KAI8823091.1 hypothetical protein EV422DRAFT_523327 [Fimicolochytrium jonesii]